MDRTLRVLGVALLWGATACAGGDASQVTTFNVDTSGGEGGLETQGSSTTMTDLTTSITAGSGDGGTTTAGGECEPGESRSCYAGDPSTEGIGECVAGTDSCTAAGLWTGCEGEVVPTTEVCNDADDDCDGDIDEDFPTETCGMGNCQVTVDTCDMGNEQNCVPGTPNPVELCDGFDDNCDGQVDEGCTCQDGNTQPCYSGPMGTAGVGECVMGTQTCAGGVWGMCNGEVTPVAETCDGLDNDCAGGVDDGNPEGGGACSTGLQGVCAAGTLTCQAGGNLNCVQNVQPSAEVCDGEDNDCANGVDDGNPGGGAPCLTGLEGLCNNGEITCSGGNLICGQTVFPVPEICGDGLDQNCMGGPDDGCLCDPLNPGPGCGPGNHCIPQPNGTPLCVPPTGLGTQYSVCTSNAQCQPIYECVNTPFGTVYCMQWCTTDFDCPNANDSCVGLNPAVFVGAQEWGVCYDGFP